VSAQAACTCQGKPSQVQAKETRRQLDPGEDALLFLLKFLLGQDARLTQVSQ